jgi:hypothetical protein
MPHREGKYTVRVTPRPITYKTVKEEDFNKKTSAVGRKMMLGWIRNWIHDQ